ncbi:MAG: hypothetical protein VX777_08350 [Chlamydiota bacterium]|nr:hypothetical protein [Chlamydiota bacterium]
MKASSDYIEKLGQYNFIELYKTAKHPRKQILWTSIVNCLRG